MHWLLRGLQKLFACGAGVNGVTVHVFIIIIIIIITCTNSSMNCCSGTVKLEYAIANGIATLV